MGDVGSLPLGAALGTVAVISKQELLLVLVGGVFVIEAISVIFQVASYKSRGKRIFLMAPIHHHFEMKGWRCCASRGPRRSRGSGGIPSLGLPCTGIAGGPSRLRRP